MDKTVFRKGISFAVILLFIGMSIAPSTGLRFVNNKLKKDCTSISESKEQISNVYKPFYNNLNHQSYSLLKSKRNVEQNFHPRQIIIKFKEDIEVSTSLSFKSYITTGIPSIDALNEKYKVTSAEKLFDGFSIYGLSSIYKFIIPNNESILNLIKEYCKDPSVEYAEPNYVYYTNIIPNDQYFNQQWALNQSNDCDIDAPEAWDIETGDSETVIAVIDTGVDFNHEDLADNIWVNSGEDLNGNGVVDPSDFNNIDDDGNGYIDDIRGYDFVDIVTSEYTSNGYELCPDEDYTERDNNPMDTYGHGTHCSGIVSAVTNNSIGIAGVSWSCSIMPIRAGFKIITNNGEIIGLLESDDIAAAIMYAANNDADVISMSWGGYQSSSLICDAIDYAYMQGVCLVASAGNGPTRWKRYPASYDDVIAVAATNNSDVKAYFSNHGSWVDVAAPGVDIYSTLIGDSYGNKSGTSMACPHVAGVAGLILSKNPSFTQDEVYTILHSSTENVTSDKYIGTGRINAYNALQRETTTVARLDSNLDDVAIGPGIFEISGTANGLTFVSYSLYYGHGIYPSDWHLIDTSSSPVEDGVLAIWDTHNIEDDGFYNVKLVVYSFDGQQSIDKTVLHLDPLLLEGWPVSLDTDGILASPVSYDLNNDGKNEIVVATYGPPGNYSYYEGRIYVLHSNGTVASGWPFITPACAPATPAIGDLDFDGTPEIVATCWGNLYVFHFDGSIVWQREFYYPHYYYSQTPVLVDIDDDGYLEIILSCEEGRMYAINHDGSNAFVITLDDSRLSTPAVGDLNNDGDFEIVVTNENNKIYVLNNDGTIFSGWPIEVSMKFIPPVIGDVDGDNNLEILVEDNYKLYVFELDGSIADGWPQSIVGNGDAEFSLGDIDSDNLPEIILGRQNSAMTKKYLYAFNGDGTPVEDWPFDGFYIESQAVIADIDSDGSPEIITRVSRDKICVFESNATVQEGWPRYLNSYNHLGSLMPCPIVTDLTGDGTIEVIAFTSFNSVYVWNLSGNADQNTWEWPMFQHDIHHTGCYKPWSDNLPPDKPGKPSGPTTGEKGIEYSYSGSTIDLDGDQLYYLFDWADGSNSGWLGPYNSGEIIQSSHIWSWNDTYNVKLKAKDVNNAQGLWSDSLVVTIGNQSPYPPTITGPISGKPRKLYPYNIVTTDPEEDDVYYFIDWGDGSNSGWLGPYGSGEKITKYHKWSEQGTFLIRAKAKDINDEESDWGYLEVTMPMNQQSQNWWFLQFLQNHPRMFPILRRLLRL